MDDLCTLDLGDVDWANTVLGVGGCDDPLGSLQAYYNWTDDVDGEEQHGNHPLGKDSPLLSDDCSLLLNEIAKDTEIDKELGLCLKEPSPSRLEDPDDWTVKIETSSFDWGLDSAGQSSLNSPSGLDDIFPNTSNANSFASSPSMSESNFSFGDVLSDCFVNQSTCTNSDYYDRQPNQRTMLQTEKKPVRLETPATTTTNMLTRSKKRPPVSTRTALMTPKQQAKPVGTRRRGRPEKDPRVPLHQRMAPQPQQGAIEPSTISLFTENSENLDRVSTTTTFQGVRHLEPKTDKGPMLATQEMIQQISTCRCEEMALRAKATTLKKGQLMRTGGVQQCGVHRGNTLQSTASAAAAALMRKPILMRKRLRECTMVCWLFRTLLTAEYRALPLNGIFEVFEDTFTNPTTAHGRHWRQSIRHCLMSSAVFVRVLTPNPRKDFLVMNEAGSWWTVHPDTEALCAREVFALGAGHRCPPQQGVPYRLRFGRTDDRQQFERRGTAFLGERIYRTPPPLAQRRISQHTQHQRQYMQQFRNYSNLQALRFGTRTMVAPPPRGDQLVVDHEEEVC